MVNSQPHETSNGSTTPPPAVISFDTTQLWSCSGCSLYCDDAAGDLGTTSSAETTWGHASPGLHVCGKASEWRQRLQSRTYDGPFALGKQIDHQTANQRVLELMRAAQHAQVVGWQHVDITDQQALLDWTAAWQGSIDRSAVDDGNSVGVALTQVGKVTATLGQIRDAADTIVVWGQHGLSRYPRLHETLSGGSTQWLNIDLPAAEGIEVLQWLRRVVQAWSRLPQLPTDLVAAREQSPGIEQFGQQRAGLWLERLLQIARSNYVAWLYTPDEAAGSIESNLEATACLRLVRQLNDLTRCVCLTLTADHNSLGAENTAAWTTGFTGRINWNESPRSGEAYAARQQCLSGAVDLLVAIVGHPAERIWPLAAGEKPHQVPTILLYTCDHPLVTQVDVAIPISQVGWDHAGDVCRLDDWLITRPALQPTQRARLAHWLAQWGRS